jgi:hypothetical protein
VSKDRFFALLVQLNRMALNGWSEGIDPRTQCQKIHERIAEFVRSELEKPE